MFLDPFEDIGFGGSDLFVLFDDLTLLRGLLLFNIFLFSSSHTLFRGFNNNLPSLLVIFDILDGQVVLNPQAIVHVPSLPLILRSV